VRLHTSVGPSATSFAAVAEEAGVTRLTLYRHFADRDELFAACMSHWRATHPPPEVDVWRSERSFDRRLHRALDDLYRWYAENDSDLYPVYRDVAFTPATTHEARRANVEGMADAILGPAARSPRMRPGRAALRHVLGYWTWRSLTIDEACAHDEAVALAVGFVLSATTMDVRRRVTRTRPDG
jgi:AcrR family transcriptional regulator